MPYDGAATQSTTPPVIHADDDEDWDVIEQYLFAVLEGRKVSAAEAMRAYNSSFKIETSRPVDTGGTQVRICAAEVMRAHQRRHPNEDTQVVSDRWCKACTRVFTYHDRFYVRRQREELSGIPAHSRQIHVKQTLSDNGTTTMYEMSMIVWNSEVEKTRRAMGVKKNRKEKTDAETATDC